MKDKAMTDQVNRQNVQRENPLVRSMADRLRDFTRMNPPIFTDSKTSEDLQEFVYERKAKGREAFGMLGGLRLKIRQFLVLETTEKILASVNSPDSKRGNRAMGTLTFRGVQHLEEADPITRRAMEVICSVPERIVLSMAVLTVESENRALMPASVTGAAIVEPSKRNMFYTFKGREEQEKSTDMVPMNVFQDIFPDYLHGVPPRREIVFGIELEPDFKPISIPLYKMASSELKGLKLKLKDLTDKGFIQPSISPWGAPMLFVKKERWNP
ncbi:hypothetical protein EJD97_022881 [Solanum chilense]|uniref:Reverse transcriptase domain-containing protein n=1 Tax=Solanum chilense TaxID=4083 RepID=A0A6N2C6J6_SOLCI|nr:hypothetical protein EJD97_022881 [Solanum chilense]